MPAVVRCAGAQSVDGSQAVVETPLASQPAHRSSYPYPEMTIARMGPSAGDVVGGWSPADEGSPFGGAAAAVGGPHSAARQLDMLSLPPDTPRVRHVTS